MITIVSIITLYVFTIELFGTEIGLLFATLFLLGMLITMAISKFTGFDKKLYEWLERE